MNQDELRSHIESANGRTLIAGPALTELLALCWPGGTDDRIEPAALPWLRRWHPERIGATIPACSCAVGHCDVCN
jgi:hypothetical protein